MTERLMVVMVSWIRLVRCPSTGILALIILAGTADPAYALVYQVVDLGPANFAGSVGQGVNGTQQVGTGPLTDSSAVHALLWSGTAGSCLDLNGTFGQSQAYATNGSQQVGYGTVSGNSHAVLWNGSGSSFVDLNPSGFTNSEARGIDDTRQAGYGTTQSQVHALLWTGTAASVADLHPPTASGFTGSYARSTSGTQQAGYGFKSGVSRALLWSGTAASYVDLNPTGYSASAAYSNARSQQVGYAIADTAQQQTHAALWSGTAGSSVDLNPSGYANSTAWSTNGGLQVGYASDGTTYHAMLWRGTASSALDLNQYLPSGFTSARAYGIDAQGNVVGYAVDSFLKNHAILWQAVPGAWKGGGNDDWGDTTHWQSGTITSVPNGRGEPVVFGDFPYTGTIDLLSADRTVGRITFHSGVQSTIKSSGGKTLKLDNGAGFATVSVAGSHSITAPISLLSDMAATTTAANDSLTISGAISGSGGLTKNGAGTLTLSGINNYSGLTATNAGTLAVNASLAGPVSVSGSGMLGGSGTISGAVTVNAGGALGPGNGPGILTVSNGVTFLPGSTFAVEVNGLAVGNECDQLATSGPATLAGTVAVSFGSFIPTGSDILFLVNNTGTGVTSGTFQYHDNEKIGSSNGYDWYITYDANNGLVPSINGGNDVAIYTVPEPSTLALVGVGTLGLLALAWRRKH